jgi:AcrR family transcriptional regulator
MVAAVDATAAVDARKATRAPALPAEERRAAIVAAALPLLLERGEMVTTHEIAAAAGIAEGTIFRVFRDKDEVIGAVIEAALDPAPLERALDAVDCGGDFEQEVAAAIAILQQRVVDVWRLLSSVGARFHEQARRPTQDLHALVALFERHRARLRVKPTVAARLLRALTLSVTHPMLAGDPMGPDELLPLFLHGVVQAC